MVQMVSINEQIIPEKVFPITNDFVPNGSSPLKWDSPSSNLTAPQGIDTTEMRVALVMLQKRTLSWKQDYYQTWCLGNGSVSQTSDVGVLQNKLTVRPGASKIGHKITPFWTHC